jgi:transposase
MMRPSNNVKVFLYTAQVDFRKSIAGLSLIVEQLMKESLFQESLFVFTNRQRNRIKILYWERNGFCLWYKVLEQERFKWPDPSEQHTKTLSGEELNWLLDGFDIWHQKPHKKLVFSSVS